MKNQETVLVSACLVGVRCRYNGKDAFSERILKEFENKAVICVCPELLAGQGIPRVACNIHNGDGQDVLEGKAKVIGIDGNDYTKAYLEGAYKALELAKTHNVKCAYLKSKSPTCGKGKIFDETGKNLKVGNGIFAELLLLHGIKVICLE